VLDTPVVTDMQIRLLGRVGVQGRAGSIEIASRSQRCILARLALRPGEFVSFDSLVDVLWPEGPPESAIASLQNQIHRLRKLLGTDVIGSSNRGYVLNVTRDAIDLHRFQQVLKDIPEASSVPGQPLAALATIDEALTLWRGDPLSEFAGEHWARGFAVRLVELHRVAQERRIEALLALGRGSEAVTAAEMVCATEPLRESAHGLLMRALASTHRNCRRAAGIRPFPKTPRDRNRPGTFTSSHGD
jgi:DNA-binding SARP family transcriptional activator